MPQNPSAEEYYPLLKSQRNEAFGWVVRSGFDPGAFEVGDATWGDDLVKCTRFAYRDSPYFFDISTVRGAFSARHSPGASEILTYQMSLGRDFASVERPFLAWLAYLRREVEAVDLWDLYLQGPGLFFAGASVDSNEPISEAEVAQITVGVERVRVYLVEQGVEGQVLADANAKLDYLVEASHRSGRFDWANIAFSTLFNIALAAAFDPERARVLFEILATPVRQLLAGH
jgi:hypothetical protein